MTEEEEARRIARAERLRELRGARSQLWVANQLGVTPRAYEAWEAGGGISPENVEALAALHKIDEDYILYGNDRRPSPDQVTEMLNLLRSLDQRLARVEDLLAEQELAALERDAEHSDRPKDKRRGRRASDAV